MRAASFACPTCGAGHEVKNPGVIRVVCAYCGNAIFWDQEQVQAAGKQAVLPEGFSRLYRGATGTLCGRPVRVLGRVRYGFDNGFWDEWFVEYGDGSIAWLTEDNFEFSLQTRVAAQQIPPFEALQPGRPITFQGIEFRIQEVGTARCLGLEGELPVARESGETYRYADGASLDGRHALGVEFDADPPTIFKGRWLDASEIVLADEGEAW